MEMWLTMQKLAFYSGHGMVFGRFLFTYGCTPGICMEYGSTDIQDQMHTESFCSWSHDGHGLRTGQLN